MILVVGNKLDSVINYFINFLKENTVKYFFLKLEDVGTRINFDKEIFFFENKHYKWIDFTGAYNRLIYENKKDYRINNCHSYIIFILNNVIKNVINKPCYSKSNFVKPVQLEYLKSNFILSPKTLIAANTTIYNNYYSNDFIIKSISSERSIVNTVLSFKNNRVFCPKLIQQNIIGHNIRVHVINDQVISIKIKSQDIDYRYSSNVEYEQIELPRYIVSECIAMTKKLNLVFSGIDLLMKNDQYYLLEVNTMPAYFHFELKVKSTCITEMLVNYLRGKR